MKQFKLSTKAWIAIGFVTLFLIVFAFNGGNMLTGLFYFVIAFSTAGIAAFDSTHIHLRRYKTWLSYGPIGVFIVCALFWPVAIVWYFVVRTRIACGTMPLRDEQTIA